MSEKQTIIEEYLLYTKKHSEVYGERTVVLLQCGKFYEIYGYADCTGNIVGSSLVEAAGSCDLRIAKKAQTFAFSHWIIYMGRNPHSIRHFTVDGSTITWLAFR